MEENEVNISYNFIKFPDNQVTVTSDIDENPDYLTNLERSMLITKHIDDLFTQLFKDIEIKDANNLDNESDETIKKLELISDTRDILIMAILNISYNKYNALLDKEIYPIQYSLAIYKTEIDNKKYKNDIYNTVHSEGLQVGDPLMGAGAFVLDVVEKLLLNRLPSKQIKEQIAIFLKDLYQNVEEFIDEIEGDV